MLKEMIHSPENNAEPIDAVITWVAAGRIKVGEKTIKSI
jgi:hypothetical protein